MYSRIPQHQDRVRRRSIMPMAGLLLAIAVAPACARGAEPVHTPTDSGAAERPSLELVESFPLETTLDHPEIPDAGAVWSALIGAARERVELAHFYGATAPGSQLEQLIRVIEELAARGVAVRFVFDRKFYERQPEVPDRLKEIDGVEVRIADYNAATGGVLHAKYFVVDGEVGYLGSQNFDWRSLEHIQELGVVLRHPALVAGLNHAFAVDWALGAGKTVPEALEAAGPAPLSKAQVVFGAEPHAAEVVISPQPLTTEAHWDLPRILAALEGAKAQVRVQLMSYSVKNYDDTEYRGLDNAVRAAAGRGVRVQLLLADWSKREHTIGQLQELQRLENIEVKLVTIPQWSGGFIPYARVIHAKFMTVDGHLSWVGTSNWSGDYFHASRNVGLVVDGPVFAKELERLFDGLWSSDYATTVDPDATYEPPRVGE